MHATAHDSRRRSIRRATTTATLAFAVSACSGAASPLETADEFITAFYTYDAAELEPFLTDVDANSATFIRYYQGWAEGGNYAIVNRAPCEQPVDDLVRCPVTVEDDLAKALELDFNVTDTFSLAFEDGVLTNIETSSDDPPVVDAAFDWAFENRRDTVAGPCDQMFSGGTTPGECVRTVVSVFEEFADSDDFPG